MNKFWVAFVATAVGSSALAQTAVLYQPAREVKDQGLTIKSWGSGTISETDETAYQGTHSVRISTHNYFQGGILGFGVPVDLTRDYNVKTNLLRLTFKLADSGVVNGGGGKGAGFGPSGPGIGGGGNGKGGGFGAFGPGGPGGPGGPPGIGGRGGGQGTGRPPIGGGGPPGGFPGGGPGVGGRGPGQGGRGGIGPGGIGGGGAGGSATTTVLKSFRLIVTTTDGKKSEVYVPANTSAALDEGWKTVAIPLQAITGFDRTNKTIQSIAISGNTTSTFYVGDLRVIDDSTPIRGELNPDVREQNLALGDEVTLSAVGFGGASILRYTWDFDDRDGIQVDAEGQTVTRRFRKAGTFTVTLTISDYYGLKAPYSVTMKVTVNP